MFKKIIPFGIFLLLLGGCGSTFKPVARNFSAKPGASLAVISGLEKNSNLQLAHHITDAIKNHSEYRVFSQEKIRKAVKDFPQNIQGPYGAAYFYIETDYKKTDMEKIKQIQKTLGADYLLVLWAPVSTSYNGSSSFATHVVSQLFEFPGAREVGRGKYDFYAAKGTDEEIRIGMERTAKKVAQELAAKTGMSK